MNVVKIGFVLLSNSMRPAPSTRIAVLNMLPFLQAAGFDLHIVFEPENASEKPDVSGLARRLIAEGFQIVFLQKVHGPSVEMMTRELSSAGIKTVYVVCDLVNVAMAEAADATVVVTDFLKNQYPAHLHHKIHTVHDGIEDSSVHKSSWANQRGSSTRPLRAVLVTSSPLVRLPQIGVPPPWLEITILGQYPGRQSVMERLRGSLRVLRNQPATNRLDCFQFMINPRIHCVPWSKERVRENLLIADIGIIPIDTTPIQLPHELPPFWKRKSENRLTLMMSAGLPVIATPIPSYEPIIQHEVNGYFAQTRTEWRKCLEALRDPEVRGIVGKNARTSVVDKYSLDEQSRGLLKVLRGLDLAGRSI